MKHYTKNKFSFIGRIAKDSILRTVGSDDTEKKVTNIDLALSVGKDQDTSYMNNIALWGQRAEFASKYCPKGTLVLVEGRVEPDTIVDEVSKKNYHVTKLIGEEIKILSIPNTSNEE